MSASSTRNTAISLLHHYVGDDSAAMDAVLEAVERRLGCRIDATGDAHVELTAKTSLLSGDPPDVWDDWPGRNMHPYRKATVLGDITDLWDDAGFTRSFFDHAREAAAIDGQFHAVPTNVQRQNNLFYNVDLFEAAGIDPAGIDDPRSLVSALDAVASETDASGIVVPQKRPWPAFDVWDMLVLAESDVDRYDALYRGGEATRHRDVVRDALNDLDELLAHSPDDAVYLDWQQGLDRFRSGEAATFCMGDWAAGVLDNADGFDYRSDWDSIPFPGTEGVYQVVMDALFTSPLSDNGEMARSVLREVGSADLLETFTRIRGAIPPRDDCSIEGHSRFFQQQMEHYRRSSEQVSATRGTGILPEQRVELLSAMASYIVGEQSSDAVVDTVVSALGD